MAAVDYTGFHERRPFSLVLAFFNYPFPFDPFFLEKKGRANQNKKES
jgi:hypothetical protein